MIENKTKNLQDLKNSLALMGGYVEKALDEATKALIERQSHRHDYIETLEKKINEIHVFNDESCFKLLAKLSPFAGDLRLILACYKMNNDLERMGDHATNISRGTQNYLKRTEIPLEKDFLKLISEARFMVKTSLDAFINSDVVLAEKVLLHDDVVDDLKDNIMNQMKELMKTNTAYIESGVDFILFSRNLERIGDLATNIAEEVIFISSGNDIRHGGVSS